MGSEENSGGWFPILVKPRGLVESTFGKATLLTNASIDVLLDALDTYRPSTDTAVEITAELYDKLYSLWTEKGPYESGDTYCSEQPELKGELSD